MKAKIYRAMPTEDQVAHAKQCYADRSAKQIFGSSRDFTKGEDAKNFFGTVAETIAADLFTHPRPTMNGPDGGWDLLIEGLKVDVKTSIRSGPFKKGYVHNVYARQVHNNPADAYLMVSYNRTTGEYELCGWVRKTDFLAHATHTPAGGTRTRADGSTLTVQGTDGMYEISQEHLQDLQLLRLSPATFKNTQPQ